MKTSAYSFPTASSRFPAAHCPPPGGRVLRVEGKSGTATAVAERIQLSKNRILRLERGSCVSGISIARGSVWITETPGTDDVVAEGGEFVRIRGGWPVVVQALTLTDAVLVFSREGES